MAAALNWELQPGISIKSATADELLAFLQDEQVRWAKVSEAKTRHPSLRDRAVEQQIHHLRRMVVAVAEQSNEEKWADRLSVLHLFKENHDGGRALCSLIPADAAVLLLVESDPDAAVIGMSARQRGSDTIQKIAANDRADAILALSRFQAAATGLPALETSYTAFAEKAEGVINRWRHELAAANEKYNHERVRAEMLAAAIESQTGEQAAAHAQMIEDHRKAIEALKQQFLTEMALRGPVQYWAERAGKGYTIAWRWLAGFLAAAFGIFGAVVWAGPGLLSLLKDSNNQISLAAVPLLVAALIPLLWILRHFARLFTDNLADARDAAQRSALTSTYLALSAQEKVEFTKEERVIIMQALFRPSPAQPADEGVPVPLLELLKR